MNTTTAMIRTMIVDDEVLARQNVEALLRHDPDITIVAQCNNGTQAVEAIRQQQPDLLFLDVQMPGMTGFEVLAKLPAALMPQVVFVTAYDHFALQAFEVQAVDYLLKPFAISRLRKVLERLRKACASPVEGMAERLREVLDSISSPPKFLRTLVVKKDADRELFLDVERVNIIRSDRNYVRFLTAEGEYSKRAKISEIEGRLDPDRFLRVNRSDVVRLDAVKEIEPWFHGDARIVMRDGKVVMWSRRYRKGRSPAGEWQG